MKDLLENIDEIALEELVNFNLTTLRQLAKKEKVENYSTIPKMQLLNILSYKLATKRDIRYSYGELDIVNDTFGFLRNTPQGVDVYVSNSQIKKFLLRQGDIIAGEVSEPVKEEGKYG